VCKVGGAFLGGVIGGFGRRNALTVACGLNTQGTMGIIVGLIAFEMGVFNQDAFSVVVIVCILTTLLIGPQLQWAIKGVKRPLAKYFDREHVFLDVEGQTGELDSSIEHYPFKSIGEFIQRHNFYTDVEAELMYEEKGVLPVKKVIFFFLAGILIFRLRLKEL